MFFIVIDYGEILKKFMQCNWSINVLCCSLIMNKKYNEKH